VRCFLLSRLLHGVLCAAVSFEGAKHSNSTATALLRSQLEEGGCSGCQSLLAAQACRGV
jgi:hypothetical protein